MWITTLCVLSGLLVMQVLTGAGSLRRSHVIVYGGLVTSAVTLLAVAVVVLGRWNLSSAVSGAAEVNATLTRVAELFDENETVDLRDFAEFDGAVKSLRLQRWVVLAVVLAVVVSVLVLGRCFREPVDSREVESWWSRGNAPLLIMMSLLSAISSGCAIASASCELWLEREFNGEVPGSLSLTPRIITIVVPAVVLILSILSIPLYCTLPSAYEGSKVVWRGLLVVVMRVLLAGSIGFSATRAGPAYDDADTNTSLLARVCEEDESSRCRKTEGIILVLRILLPAFAGLGSLCVELFLFLLLPLSVTKECNCRRVQVANGDDAAAEEPDAGPRPLSAVNSSEYDGSAPGVQPPQMAVWQDEEDDLYGSYDGAW
jgi:hypothetical protein